MAFYNYGFEVILSVSLPLVCEKLEMLYRVYDGTKTVYM